MRITGGKARSIPIKCPKGSVTRPATDRMRESVFSSLNHLVAESSFLDLYAGAGSYGLEAISRGAAGGVFVERDRLAIQSIKQNLSAVGKSIGQLNVQGKFNVRSADVIKWLSHEENSIGQKFDLVFIDPPYTDVADAGRIILEKLIPHLKRDEASFIVFEMPELFENYPDSYQCIKTYGKGREDARCMLLKYDPTVN